MRPRWHKVLADLWSNKVRSILVIASISVGLFAVGMISTAHTWLTEAMRDGYPAVNPANIMIRSAGFNQDFVERVRHISGVKEAEGAAILDLRLKLAGEKLIPITITARPEIQKMNINRLELVEGIWPPGDREIVLEINKLSDTGAKVGDYVTLRLPSGKLREMKVVGVVHDLTIGAGGIGGGFFLAPAQGYITYNTLAWLEQPATLNQLYATVSAQPDNLSHIRDVSSRIMTEFERNGLVTLSSAERLNTDHPNVTYLDAITAVLFVLGLLVVFLSGFLITNTLSALLNQQIQQVGIMKTIGASRIQINGVYMVLILVYSLLALAIAVPLSNQAAWLELQFLSRQINFNLPEFHTVPRSLILQIVIALIVPQLAGAIPIWQGTRITIQQALSGIGSSTSENQGRLYQRLSRLKGLSRPLLISLRNTFRRRIRLILTLFTLILGGAIFIATFNVRGSLDNYIARLGKYFIADVNLSLDRPYRTEEIQQILMQVPGVVVVEGWSAAKAELVTGGQSGESVSLQAPPADSRLIEPIMRSGRWLLPGDQNAIVLSELFEERYPALAVGDTITLKVNGEETDWVVVGFFQFAGKSGGLFAYTTFDYLSQTISQPGKSAVYRIVAQDGMHTLTQQEDLGRRVENHLNNLGIQANDVRAGLSLQTSTSSGLNTLTTFLLIMALLMATVGSIGLMGTMSLNVMERTREIGVMRAIGATDRIITNLVIVEGVFIGMVSWLLACLAAFPIGKLLSDVISIAIFSTPITFTFTPTGILIWLGLVLALSIFASVLPARSAARLTIREVLAYE